MKISVLPKLQQINFMRGTISSLSKLLKNGGHLTVLILCILFCGCAKDNRVDPLPAPQAHALTESFKTVSLALPNTLGVILYTNSTLQRGQTFIFNLSVKNGSTPVNKATIGIDDPIRGLCTSVT